MMQWLAWLFFSFRGRIPRKWYWLGQAVLLALGALSYLIIFGTTLPAPGPLPTSSILLNVLFLIPAFAIAVKRLNDRSHSMWVAGVWLVLALVEMFASALGLFADPLKLGRGEVTLLAVMSIVSLWFLIDLGFLRGVPGPNRHGANPLGDDTKVSHAQRTGRSLGANIRDIVTGATALLVTLGMTGHNLGIPNIVEWILVPSDVRRSMHIWRERQANKPALEAQKEGEAAYKVKDYDGLR